MTPEGFDGPVRGLMTLEGFAGADKCFFADWQTSLRLRELAIAVPVLRVALPAAENQP